MTKHKLVDGCVKVEAGGIAARCTCGWSSLGHFTGMGASAAFQDHVEEEEAKKEKVADRW